MLAARSFPTEFQGAIAGVEHQIELTAESLWNEVAGRLRGALNDTTYSTWFGEAQGLELSDANFVLALPNDFTRDWIEGHFLGLIGAAIRDVTGEERPVELRVVDMPGTTEHAGPVAAEAEGLDPVELPRLRPPGTQSRPESGGFNTKYTFDSFVIGSSHPLVPPAPPAVAAAAGGGAQP